MLFSKKLLILDYFDEQFFESIYNHSKKKKKKRRLIFIKQLE